MKVHRILFLTALAFLLTACDVDLYRSLPEDEANQMLALLLQHHINAEKKQEEDGITLRVEQSQFINAVELLRLNGYPHRQFTTADKMFPANQLVVSPQEEQQKINFLKEQRIEGMLSQMEGVINTKVTIALPTYDEGSNYSPSSVAVFIKYSPQVNMEAFRVKIKDLIEKSIPGLQYDKISILMQPAEFRMVPDVPARQTFWIRDVINTNKGKVMKWLIKYPYQLTLSLTGLLLGVGILIGYFYLRRRF
ncbi:EscJ/YscJ/HrcJ family type III secretion inner membrane ring protein SsaJ [Salmonella enterica subsp. houtenae]|uniref:Lipoprotein n=1 Tax=Salmonella houtenae TaxID=59205 RepID=A0A5Y2S9I9_SALHO|nr:EscJ/YscJ/HrcJ family type III secretion inner membrane ring protein SsaJ [Salmonella enterica subsp. houtenae]QKT19521.1 EscJ/YscJ/HrcJ family type III secretion inner membrane ring protein SsaJ [Salmonella enterica]HAU3221638.1 EscJ/YscJ/HrcJ family type III secretion inner membrane ring protein SsaJ [Salmonella enterica subsp. houtenae]